MQLWEAWKEAACDYLFNEEVKNLFQSLSNSTEQPHFNRYEIYETKSDDEHIMQNILKLREFKIFVESLNVFLLGIKLGGNVPPALQWPKVNKQQSLKVVVCAGVADNGCYTARCQAVWHGMHSCDFQSLFSTCPKADISAVHFIKQMLREKEWMNCTPGNCTLHRKMRRPCPMPMQQFCCNTNGHDVPIFQVEVAGDKGMDSIDDKKLCLISLWNLCFASKAYGMEVGKDSTMIIKMQKNWQMGIIDCSKFPVDLNGSGRDDKIFQQLLVLLCMIGQKEK